MRLKKLSLTEALEEHAAFEVYEHDGNDTDRKREKMARFIRLAMDTELTQRRRQCIRAHYLEGKPVDEIARELGIRPTTVYKHISKARSLIKKRAEYILL